MKLRSWILGAVLLSAFAPASHAAESEAAESKRLEQLQNDVGQPEDFKTFVEGSRPGNGDAPAPEAAARRDAAAAPRAPLRAGRISSAPRREAPPPSAETAPEATPAGPSGDNVPLRGMAAAFGLGLLLVAAGLVLAPGEADAPAALAAAEPLPEAPPAPAPPPAAAPAPPPAPPAATETVFIDTRMPAPTWRAISWREQNLIERWDASREKALGLASLPDWLDSQGRVEGVDVPLLKAKLFRGA
jgi:hypothetical protein